MWLKVSKTTLLSAELLQDFCLQAVFAISDPIRDDVPNAVSECQRAGINVKMVTGDTSATAIEIAKQIGIWNEEGVSETESNVGISQERSLQTSMTMRLTSE